MFGEVYDHGSMLGQVVFPLGSTGLCRFRVSSALFYSHVCYVWGSTKGSDGHVLTLGFKNLISTTLGYPKFRKSVILEDQIHEQSRFPCNCFDQL